MDKRTFILKTLLPYKTGKEKCAFDGKYCVYLTKDGRKCAIGKHLKKGKWQEHVGGCYELFTDYKKEYILKKRAMKMDLSNYVWNLLQEYHDSIAKNRIKSVNDTVRNLELSTNLKFPELYF